MLRQFSRALSLTGLQCPPDPSSVSGLFVCFVACRFNLKILLGYAQIVTRVLAFMQVSIVDHLSTSANMTGCPFASMLAQHAHFAFLDCGIHVRRVLVHAFIGCSHSFVHFPCQVPFPTAFAAFVAALDVVGIEC